MDNSESQSLTGACCRLVQPNCPVADPPVNLSLAFLCFRVRKKKCPSLRVDKRVKAADTSCVSVCMFALRTVFHLIEKTINCKHMVFFKEKNDTT